LQWMKRAELLRPSVQSVQGQVQGRCQDEGEEHRHLAGAVELLEGAAHLQPLQVVRTPRGRGWKFAEILRHLRRGLGRRQALREIPGQRPKPKLRRGRRARQILELPGRQGQLHHPGLPHQQAVQGLAPKLANVTARRQLPRQKVPRQRQQRKPTQVLQVVLARLELLLSWVLLEGRKGQKNSRPKLHFQAQVREPQLRQQVAQVAVAVLLRPPALQSLA